MNYQHTQAKGLEEMMFNAQFNRVFAANTEPPQLFKVTVAYADGERKESIVPACNRDEARHVAIFSRIDRPTLCSVVRMQ